MDSLSADSSRATRRALTDSPWFWLLLFSLFALVMLHVIGGKYSLRQSQLERQHQGRQFAHQAATDGGDASRRVLVYSSPEELNIPLRPLRIVSIALIAVSTVMFVRGRRRGAKATRG